MAEPVMLCAAEHPAEPKDRAAKAMLSKARNLTLVVIRREASHPTKAGADSKPHRRRHKGTLQAA